VRILIVTQYFWPEAFRINDLAKGLAAEGHKVTVLTGMPNYPDGRFAPGYGFWRPGRETYGAIDVIRVPLIARGAGSRLRLALNYASFALIASLLGPLRAGRGHDIVLVYEPSPVTVGLPALAMKAVTSSPVLFWVQDLWPESLSATGAVRSQSVLKAVEYLVRLIYRSCDRILVQSRAFIEPIEALGVPRAKIVYYPNSAESYYRPITREAASLPVALPPGFRVMFAGNFGAAQGFDTVLAAADALRNERGIQWLLVGDGRELPRVRQEIAARNLGATVRLLGRHPPESMPSWFAHADAMLVSLRGEPIFAYTIPAKVQSYLACGKPIIASLNGEGARIIAEAGAGLAASADDPDALARAVLEMARMPAAEREAMGRRARAYFETHFEREELIRRLLGMMDEVVKPTP
jgi:glycosyltransferase involved in cell wall biosynthesis